MPPHRPPAPAAAASSGRGPATALRALRDLRDRRALRDLCRPLMGAAVVAALAAAFALLGSEVREGRTRAFDQALLQAALALRRDHPGLTGVMRDFSGVGSTAVLTVLTLATCGWLLLVRRLRLALLVGASIGIAALGVGVLKAFFDRARPDALLAALVQPGPSFPSGHASMSTVVFLTLGALLALTRERRAERLYVLGCAGAVALAVGCSRVVLGVHWGTDVLAGWAVGCAWALLWLAVAQATRRPHPSRREI